MNKLIADEKGASSVLIVIMMVVLIVFGLAIFTTSLSNLRLADKKYTWLRDYYNTETLAMTKIAVLEKTLKNYKKADLPEQDVHVFFAKVLKISKDRLVVDKDDTNTYDYILEFDVSLNNAISPKNIALRLGINLQNSIKDRPHNIDILKYEQWQKDFEYDTLFEFD